MATKNQKTMPAAKKQASGNNKQKQNSGANDTLLLEFFYGELKDIYWAEKHLTKALPKLQKAATNEELKSAFEEHLQVTQTHIERLEQIFELCNKKAQAKKCDAMEGITIEAQSIIEDTDQGTATRDVGLILAGQKVEHYEIATYGGLAQLARTLELNEVADILEETLQEEKDADEKLTSIAENDINYQAAQEDGKGEDDDSEEEDDDSEETDETETDEADEEEDKEEDDQEVDTKKKTAKAKSTSR